MTFTPDFQTSSLHNKAPGPSMAKAEWKKAGINYISEQ